MPEQTPLADMVRQVLAGERPHDDPMLAQVLPLFSRTLRTIQSVPTQPSIVGGVLSRLGVNLPPAPPPVSAEQQAAWDAQARATQQARHEAMSPVGRALDTAAGAAIEQGVPFALGALGLSDDGSKANLSGQLLAAAVPVIGGVKSAAMKAKAPLVEAAAELEYATSHRPPGPDNGAPAHDLTGAGTIYPDDVYGPKATQYYGTAEPAMDVPTFKLLNRLKGNPEADVVVYRAVPSDVTNAAINPGDWVAISEKYARMHGEGPLRGDYKIVSKRVKASDIFTNGDSIHEWGYHPQERQ